MPPQIGASRPNYIELWMGVGSRPAPASGDVFTDALLAWLLAQE